MRVTSAVFLLSLFVAVPEWASADIPFASRLLQRKQQRVTSLSSSSAAAKECQTQRRTSSIITPRGGFAKKSKATTTKGAAAPSQAKAATSAAATASAAEPNVLATATASVGGAAPAAATEMSPLMKDLMHRAKVGFYFGLWYALNIVYNILNKKLLNILPAPLMVGTIQLAVGGLYVLLLWQTGLRAAPTDLSQALKTKLRDVGISHSAGQLLSMMSLGAGPVSFTHIVKALEPFFSAVVSALAFGTWMAPQVYATLIPVVAGVGYACLKERSFSWLAFWTAMGSNVAFAFRAVLSKVAMSQTGAAKNLSSANVFAVVTLYSFIASIPFAVLGEGGTFLKLWNTAIGADNYISGGAGGNSALSRTVVVTPRFLVQSIIISGLFHYLNNEVMYLALGNVHPVTLAVGNTMKRVFILIASVMVFRNTITVQSAIGSAVGITGVLLYSLTKQYYEKLEAQQKQKQEQQFVSALQK